MEPGAQELQSGWPVASWNLPLGQEVHSDAEKEEYFPMAHAVHSVEPPMGLYMPLWQSIQTVPDTVEYFPAAQVMQAGAEGPDILPAGQISHCVAADAGCASPA